MIRHLLGRKEILSPRQLRDRLMRELETNVALRVEETDSPDKSLVSGRGELHLGILIETMRREGYEFQVSQPQATGKSAVNLANHECLVLDVPEDGVGSCIERLGQRRGKCRICKLVAMDATGVVIPARGLVGFRGEFMRLTRGDGIMNHSFLDYRPISRLKPVAMES